MTAILEARGAERFASPAGEARPILWWAALGGCFLALQTYVFAAWIASDHFRATPPGDTPAPAYMQPMVWLIQGGTVFLALLSIAWCVRTTRKAGRMPALAVFVLAWLTALWQDPLINYVRPVFSYNAYFVNFGSWCELIPGWLSPNGSRMPEPILFDGGVYMWTYPSMAAVCATAMRLAKRRFPSWGAPHLCLVALATVFVGDLIAEGVLVRTGMFAYPGSIASLSLWGGEWFQFPLYESFLGGGCIAATGALYYFRDDKGQLLVERGLEKLTWKRGHTLLRVLAVGGFVNLAVLTYSSLFIATTLHIDPWPAGVPSYLRNGLCGAGTHYECPGHDVHIPLRGSGPLPPFTGRN